VPKALTPQLRGLPELLFFSIADQALFRESETLVNPSRTFPSSGSNLPQVMSVVKRINSDLSDGVVLTFLFPAEALERSCWAAYTSASSNLAGACAENCDNGMFPFHSRSDLGPKHRFVDETDTRSGTSVRWIRLIGHDEERAPLDDHPRATKGRNP